MPPDAAERLLEAAERYGEEVPDSYAGCYRSPDGSLVRVGFTRDLASHSAELRSRVDDFGLIEFFDARFTKHELEEALDRATDDGFDLDIEKDGFLVDSGELDIEGNSALVTIWAPDPEGAVAKARARYGPAVGIEVAGKSPRDARPHEIDSYELVGDRTLKVYFIDVSQSELGQLSVRETDDVVTLDLVVNVWLGMSRMVKSEHAGEVELSAPLGSRDVIDGLTGKRVVRRDAEWYDKMGRLGHL